LEDHFEPEPLDAALHAMHQHRFAALVDDRRARLALRFMVQQGGRATTADS